MADSIHKKYANLLADYALDLQQGEKLYIQSTYLAEPLLQEVYRVALERGAHPLINADIRERNRIFFDYAKNEQLKFVSPFTEEVMNNFDAFLAIRAPFNQREMQNADAEKQKINQEAYKKIKETYMQRTGSGEMKRCLCEFPTSAAAQEANMSLSEYETFVYNACFLDHENPVDKWLDMRQFQQTIVDYLEKCDTIRYKNKDFDISFSTKDRTWINSDGRNNMPSGEVFTSPVENSVNGTIKFNYPSIQRGKEVEGVFFEVKDGEIINWDADKGKDVLDEIFDIPGARYFGEAAIGTNNNVKQATKNILFDEKIGGTVHMAVGQSYYHTGGQNQSSIHWDLITDMSNGGEIYADDELIYQDGQFLIV